MKKCKQCKKEFVDEEKEFCSKECKLLDLQIRIFKAVKEDNSHIKELGKN